MAHCDSFSVGLYRIRHWVGQRRLSPWAGGTGLCTDTDTASSGETWVWFIVFTGIDVRHWLFTDDLHSDFRSSEPTEASLSVLRRDEYKTYLIADSAFTRWCKTLNVNSTLACSSCRNRWGTCQQSQTEPQWKEGTKGNSPSSLSAL